MSPPRPLAVSMGDPAGIGIEITAKAWHARKEAGLRPFFLIGNPATIERQITDMHLEVPAVEIVSPAEAAGVMKDALPVLALEPGMSAAEEIMAAIRIGARLALEGEAAALVTNPIQKKRLYDAGFTHPGHTEFLAELTGRPGASVMMLACEGLRVVPATIHIPISEVPRQLTAALLRHVITTTHVDLVAHFDITEPKIAVAGLNPHAGEDGAIGREEEEIIRPVIAELTREGLGVTGPFPADSLFHPSARAKFDAAICMYHDQALIPIKTIDFAGGVNITLGLPIIRTSPDHGTAEDIAGLGRADATSLINALKMAGDMATATRHG